MSLETWKKEFVDGDAEQFKGSTDTIKALEWSIKKWKGLLHENLEKHNVVKYDKYVLDYCDKYKRCRFPINGETCSLCAMTTVKDEYGLPRIRCNKCPIRDVSASGNCWEEYNEWAYFNNPTSMIELLENTLKAEKEKQ